MRHIGSRLLLLTVFFGRIASAQDTQDLFFQMELLSRIPSTRSPHSDQDSANLSMSKLLFDVNRRYDGFGVDRFYLLLDGLALDKNSQPMDPALRKYSMDRPIQRAGIQLLQGEVQWNIGRENVLQGGFTDEAWLNRINWNNPYFRYLAPFPITQDQVSLRWTGPGVLQVQMTNDVSTEVNGRAEFSGSYRQPVILSQWQWDESSIKMKLGYGLFDNNRSHFQYLQFMLNIDQAELLVGYIDLQKKLKIGAEEATNRQSQGKAQAHTYNLAYRSHIGTAYELILVGSIVRTHNPLSLASWPAPSLYKDGYLQVSRSLGSSPWSVGMSYQARSKLLPRDLPSGFADGQGNSLAMHFQGNIDKLFTTP